jgi:hypothetical protein
VGPVLAVRGADVDQVPTTSGELFEALCEHTQLVDCRRPQMISAPGPGRSQRFPKILHGILGSSCISVAGQLEVGTSFTPAGDDINLLPPTRGELRRPRFSRR